MSQKEINEASSFKESSKRLKKKAERYLQKKIGEYIELKRSSEYKEKLKVEIITIAKLLGRTEIESNFDEFIMKRKQSLEGINSFFERYAATLLVLIFGFLFLLFFYSGKIVTFFFPMIDLVIRLIANWIIKYNPWSVILSLVLVAVIIDSIRKVKSNKELQELEIERVLRNNIDEVNRIKE